MTKQSDLTWRLTDKVVSKIPFGPNKKRSDMISKLVATAKKHVSTAAVCLCAAASTIADQANAQENTMIRFIAKFDVKPSERENFVAALRNVRDGTAREEGALGWDMYVNTDDPNQFWVDERYRDDTAVEFHQSQPYIIALADLSAQALSGPPAGYLLDLPIHSAGQQKAATAQDEPMMLFFIVPMADGTRQQIIDRLDTHVPLTRQEVGNLMFDAFTLRSDPNTVLVHEIWRTPAALWDEHFSQGYAQETGALLSELTGRDLSSLMYVVKSLE